jgi:hypothetical protein
MRVRARVLRGARRVVAVLGPVLLATGVVSAQPRPAAAPPRAPGPPRFEIGGGASWLGGYGLGSRDATLTGNSGTPGGQVVLFSADTAFGSGPGVDLQVGYWLTRRIVAEAAFQYGRPELQTTISADFEQAPPTVASDTLSQYVLEGVVRLHFTGGLGSRRALSPFASAGIGYLRQLTSDAFDVETGTVFHAGGGVAWTLGTRARGFARSWGARADARVNWRTGGIDVEDRARTWPSVGGGLFLRF